MRVFGICLLVCFHFHIEINPPALLLVTAITAFSFPNCQLTFVLLLQLQLTSLHCHHIPLFLTDRILEIA
jgi:hypothetical protein